MVMQDRAEHKYMSNYDEPLLISYCLLGLDRPLLQLSMAAGCQSLGITAVLGELGPDWLCHFEAPPT